MNYVYHLIVLLSLSTTIGLVLAGANSGTRSAAPNGVADWEVPHRMIYANQGPHYKPLEVLELLRQLETIYANTPNPDELTRLRASHVAKFIEVSRVREDKCTRENLAEINELIAYNSPYKLNLLPYLRHYKFEQIGLCKKSLCRRVQAALAKLSPQGRSQAEQLMKLIASGGKALDNVPPLELPIVERKFYLGVETFVKLNMDREDPNEPEVRGKQFKSAREWQRARDRYADQCRATVLETCQEIEKNFGPLMEYLDNDLLTSMDPKSTEWITYTKACRFVLGNFNVIVDTIFGGPRRDPFPLVRMVKRLANKAKCSDRNKQMTLDDSDYSGDGSSKEATPAPKATWAQRGRTATKS